MRAQPGPFYMDIPVPMSVFLALCDYREHARCKQEIHEIAGAAINEWLASHPAQVIGQVAGPPPLSGYQWKRLFLPDGTVLRTVCKGKQYSARVDDSRILMDGKNLTPSEFANTAGGMGRNAWLVIWLLFPGEREWKLANDCRTQPNRRAT
jgi:hypothetical protein